MNLERYEKLKFIEMCETFISGYKNMAVEAKTPGFKIEMLHEAEICEVMKAKAEEELQ